MKADLIASTLGFEKSNYYWTTFRMDDKVEKYLGVVFHPVAAGEFDAHDLFSLLSLEGDAPPLNLEGLKLEGFSTEVFPALPILVKDSNGEMIPSGVSEFYYRDDIRMFASKIIAAIDPKEGSEKFPIQAFAAQDYRVDGQSSFSEEVLAGLFGKGGGKWEPTICLLFTNPAFEVSAGEGRMSKWKLHLLGKMWDLPPPLNMDREGRYELWLKGASVTDVFRVKWLNLKYLATLIHDLLVTRTAKSARTLRTIPFIKLKVKGY
jgi:hypothetical protein